MSLINFCGGIAVTVACAIVITGLLLFALLGFCLILGAGDSIVNPHASEDARASYQNATSDISTGTAGRTEAETW